MLPSATPWTYTAQIDRSACRALLAVPCWRAASIRADEAWLKEIDISPPHLDDWNPHQAVSTAVIERRTRAKVSRTTSDLDFSPSFSWTGFDSAGSVPADASGELAPGL